MSLWESVSWAGGGGRAVHADRADRWLVSLQSAPPARVVSSRAVSSEEALERRGHVSRGVSEPEAELEVLESIQQSFFQTTEPSELCREQLQVRLGQL